MNTDTGTIIRILEGEIIGQSYFSELGKLHKDYEEELLLLSEVESKTAALTKSYMPDAARDVKKEDLIKAGRELALLQKDSSFSDILKGLQVALRSYYELYESLEGDEYKVLKENFLFHEKAVEFYAKNRVSKPDSALELVKEYLKRFSLKYS
jgi:hypothetical protein